MMVLSLYKNIMGIYKNSSGAYSSFPPCMPYALLSLLAWVSIPAVANLCFSSPLAQRRLTIPDMYNYPVKAFKNPTFKAVVSVRWTHAGLLAGENTEIGIADFLADSSAQDAIPAHLWDEFSKARGGWPKPRANSPVRFPLSSRLSPLAIHVLSHLHPFSYLSQDSSYVLMYALFKHQGQTACLLQALNAELVDSPAIDTRRTKEAVRPVLRAGIKRYVPASRMSTFFCCCMLLTNLHLSSQVPFEFFHMPAFEPCAFHQYTESTSDYLDVLCWFIVWHLQA